MLLFSLVVWVGGLVGVLVRDETTLMFSLVVWVRDDQCD